MPYTPEEIARAGETAKKVQAKAVAALLPIQREMQIMGWGHDLQAIMWQAILHLALDRLVDTVDLARSGGPVKGREPVGAGRDTEFRDSDPQRSRPADQR